MITDFSGNTGRYYPIDRERKARCMVELARRGMTITDLAYATSIDKSTTAKVISGRMLSETYERQIANFLHIDQNYLFPTRSSVEIAAMRALEQTRKAGAA